MSRHGSAADAREVWPILTCHSDKALEGRCRKTTRALGLNPRETTLVRATNPNASLPTPSGVTVMGNLYGCAHPTLDKCPLCCHLPSSGGRGFDLDDPFMPHEEQVDDIVALREQPVRSVAEAKDVLTYFESYKTWKRAFAFRAFMLQHYKTISDAVKAIKIRHLQISDQNKRDAERRHMSERHTSTLGTWPAPSKASDDDDDDDDDDEKSDHRLPNLYEGKEYMNWLYAPNDSETPGRRKPRGIFRLYATMPSRSEVAQYLDVVYRPPPALHQKLSGAKRASPALQPLAAGSRSTSVRAMALHQSHQKRYDQENLRVHELRADRREVRRERIAKFPHLRSACECDFPEIVLVADTERLEKRLDYIITQHADYVNVFYVETPLAKSRPRGGLWGQPVGK